MFNSVRLATKLYKPTWIVILILHTYLWTLKEAKLEIIFRRSRRSTKFWIALRRAQEESFDANFQESVDAHKWQCYWFGCSFMLASISLSAVRNMIHFMYFKLGLGQTSNFSWDEPNLVSQVHEKFDVWLSWGRLNEFGGVQHVLSVCFTRIERLKTVSWTNVELHMRRTKLMN